MNRKLLYTLWGAFFILCAGLGFIPEPEGLRQYLLTGASLVFFVPPALLTLRGGREERLLVRNLSALSLGLTALLLVVNFLGALGSETLGNVLHFILVVVSSPMIASGNWALSLFLWACLLFMSIRKR